MAILRNLFLTARQILLPTIRLQEEPDEATFGVADRFERGAACGLTASSPPDTDLSCLPIVPPVLPAWANTEDALADAKCDRARKAIRIDARRIMCTWMSW